MKLTIAIIVFTFLLSPLHSAVTKITIWHTARGESKRAYDEVANAFNLAHADVQVSLLAVPWDAFHDKLRMQIPVGTGPDIFVAPHDFTGAMADAEMIIPLESYLSKEELSEYFPNTLAAFEYMYPDSLWAVPGSFNNVALFYNKTYLKNPPRKMSEILTEAKRFSNPKYGQYGRWGFAYEIGNPYIHTMWLQGFGGTILRNEGKKKDGNPSVLPLFYTRPMIKACNYLLDSFVKSGVCPKNPDGTLVGQLFNTGNALFTISGQWFRANIDPRVEFGLDYPPVIDETGSQAVPYLTVVGWFVTANSRNQKKAIEVIRYFTGAAMGRVMAKVGKESPANMGAYKYPEVSGDPISSIFFQAAKKSIPMPIVPEMDVIWARHLFLLGDILGGKDVETILRKAQAESMAEIAKSYGEPGIFKKYEKLEKPLD